MLHRNGGQKTDGWSWGGGGGESERLRAREEKDGETDWRVIKRCGMLSLFLVSMETWSRGTALGTEGEWHFGLNRRSHRAGNNTPEQYRPEHYRPIQRTTSPPHRETIPHVLSFTVLNEREWRQATDETLPKVKHLFETFSTSASLWK